MTQRLLAHILVFLAPLSVSAEEILARVQTGRYNLSIVASGVSNLENCQLNLVAEAHNLRRASNLRRSFYNCMLFGPIQITAGKVSQDGTAFVFVEAARGGDGDHTGPIVEVFHLSPAGFRKIGELELFDSTYPREEGNILVLSGKVLFDFCDVCDGPDASQDKIFVPVQVKILPDSLTVRSTLNATGKASVTKEFEKMKNERVAEIGQYRNYTEYVRKLEERFRALLAK